MSSLHIDMTCIVMHNTAQIVAVLTSECVLSQLTNLTSVTVLSKLYTLVFLEPPSFASVHVEFSCDVAIMDPIPVTVNWMVRSV